jgi:hypothetical protein
MADLDSVIPMDAGITALLDIEAERARAARRNRRSWILWQRFRWTVAEVDALPDHVVDYAMRMGS